MNIKSIKSKIAVGALTALPALASFAEGETPAVDTAQITALQNKFTAYIGAGANAVVALLTAGLGIVAVMWAWRLLKKAFNGSK